MTNDNTIDPQDDMLTIAELAVRCAVSKSTVRRWVRRGLIAFVVLPEANVRFHPDDVEEFIETYRADGDSSCPG